MLQHHYKRERDTMHFSILLYSEKKRRVKEMLKHSRSTRWLITLPLHIKKVLLQLHGLNTFRRASSSLKCKEKQVLLGNTL